MAVTKNYRAEGNGEMSHGSSFSYVRGLTSRDLEYNRMPPLTILLSRQIFCLCSCYFKSIMNDDGRKEY